MRIDFGKLFVDLLPFLSILFNRTCLHFFHAQDLNILKIKHDRSTSFEARVRPQRDGKIVGCPIK